MPLAWLQLAPLTALLAARSDTPFQLSLPSLAPLAWGLALVVLLALLGRVPLSYNVRNMQVRWVTTLMTTVAFVLVIGLLTGMLAFVNGMYALTLASGQPGNVIVLSEGSTDESFSNLGFRDVGELELQPGVLRDESDRPRSSRETYVVVNQPVQVRLPGRPKGRFTQVRGVDDAALSGDVHGLSLVPSGQWISQQGVQSLAPSAPAPAAVPSAAAAPSQEAIEAVLGEGIARVLGADRKPEELAKAKNRERIDVGETFPLGGRTWLVVGVIKQSGSTFDSEIWAKRDIVAKMFGKPVYSSVVLRTAGPDEAKRLAVFLNRDYTKASVNAFVETEYFASLTETNKQFLISAIFFTAIMALGGVFGVMNTMFAAVSTRSRDIGVLRILGFSRWQVQASFLLESLVLSLLGGAVGCAIGTLVSHGQQAASVLSGGPGGGKFVTLELVVSGDIIATGLALSLAMGLIGGVIPSIGAMLVRPLESLR